MRWAVLDQPPITNPLNPSVEDSFIRDEIKKSK